MIARVGAAIGEALEGLSNLDRKALLAQRREKYLAMGQKSLN